MGKGTPFCIGLRMSRVFWGRGFVGSLVTGRLNNLTLEGIAIYWFYRGELRATIRQALSSRQKFMGKSISRPKVIRSSFASAESGRGDFSEHATTCS